MQIYMYLSGLLKLLKYTLTKKKTILINEASGLGDYLWVRSYFKELKKTYPDYKIIICTTKRWDDFARDIDSKYIDVFISFVQPYKPKFKEILPLKLFKFDIFINFREDCYQWTTLSNTVKAKKRYTSIGFRNSQLFYPDIYDKIIQQVLPSLSKDKPFKHTIDIIRKNPIKQDYCILTLGGFAGGKLSFQQLKTIIEIINKNTKLNIVILGFGSIDSHMFENLKNSLPKDILDTLISGCNTFRTSELPSIVNDARFVITTNTSIWHFSIQLNKPHLILSPEASWIYGVYNYKYVDKNNINFITAKNNIQNISNKEIEEKLTSFIKLFFN